MMQHQDQWIFIPDLTWLYKKLTEKIQAQSSPDHTNIEEVIRFISI